LWYKIFTIMKKDLNPTTHFAIMNLLFLFFATYTFLFCVQTKDWCIENILVIAFILYLDMQHLAGNFKFSNIGYACLFLFLGLHEWGAQYVYSEHPVGEWMRTTMHLQRNGYDRLVHFSFGFLLYLPLTEIINYRNKGLLKNIGWRAMEFIICCATIFELIEFAVANYIFPDALGKTYVGTQGDIWDAQKDILMAIIGCGLAMMAIEIKNKISRKYLKNEELLELNRNVA
jgi:putative membrane protein